MNGSSLLAWCFLAGAPALFLGCAASQVPDSETAAEMALDEAGEAPAEEALSESEKAAREWRESEEGKAAEKTEAPKKTGGLVVLPAVESAEEEGDEEPDETEDSPSPEEDE